MFDLSRQKVYIIFHFLYRAFILKDTSSNPEKIDTPSALSIIGLRSLCQLLTLYRVPYNDKDRIVELRVHCMESNRKNLKRTVKRALKEKWMQIEGQTESSDFTINSGEKIEIEFTGNVKQVDGLPTPIITFIRNSTCFVGSQLQSLGADEMRGQVLMHHGTEVRDWKPLEWKDLKANYENNGI